MFHLDANTFGDPSYSMGQSPEGQFMAGGANDVGRGLYREYNPTAPVPVSLNYQWDGDTYSAFRQAWHDATQINHGANWFTIDLPLMLAIGAKADGNLYPENVPVTDPVDGVTVTMVQAFQRYLVHTRSPFKAAMAGYNRWNVTLEIEVDASKKAADWEPGP